MPQKGFIRARQFLAEMPQDLLRLAEIRLGKAMAESERWPEWPLLKIPLLLMESYGIGPEITATYLAGVLLLYAAADVIDDAQDGELDLESWGSPPWHHAVNLGNGLVFAAQEAFVTAASWDGPARQLALHLARSGRSMVGGQHRDFALCDPASTEADYLTCIEGKSGGSLGFFCRAAGILGGASEVQQELLGEFGTVLGAALQLRSDVAEVFSAEPSPDLANGRHTLPLIFARAIAGPEDHAAISRLSGITDKGRLVALLERLGARSYCALRLSVYLHRCQALLSELDLPERCKAALTAAIADTKLDQPRPV